MGLFDLLSTDETKQRDKLLSKFSSDELAERIALLKAHCFQVGLTEYDYNFNAIKALAFKIKEQYDYGKQAVIELCNYGVECKRRGQLNEALQFYKEAAILMPKRSMTYYSLAKSLYLLNRLSEALSAYKLAYIFAERVTSDLFRHAGHALLDAGRENCPTAIEYRISIGGYRISIGEKKLVAYKLYDLNDNKYIKYGKDALTDLRVAIFFQ